MKRKKIDIRKNEKQKDMQGKRDENDFRNEEEYRDLEINREW